MHIEPILEKLLEMLETAGIPITTRYPSAVTEIQNPPTGLAHEIFKRFTYLNFDCSSFVDEELACSNLFNGGITFECGNYIFPSGEYLFYFGFRRTFRIIIPFLSEDGERIATSPDEQPLEFTKTVACDFLFEPNDSPPILEAKRLSYQFAQQDERLDKFFTQLSLLDEVRIPIDAYKPRTLALYLDE